MTRLFPDPGSPILAPSHPPCDGRRDLLPPWGRGGLSFAPSQCGGSRHPFPLAAYHRRQERVRSDFRHCVECPRLVHV
jgi:hypothetical protein